MGEAKRRGTRDERKANPTNRTERAKRVPRGGNPFVNAMQDAQNLKQAAARSSRRR